MKTVSQSLLDGDYFSKGFPTVLKDTALYTPDVPYLNQFENHYVFVYGTLKRTFSRSGLLKQRNNKFCGVGVTESDDFDMLLAVNNSAKPGGKQFPVLFTNMGNDRRGKVKGELWLVDNRTLLTLDRIEAQGHLYDRVWEPIWVGNNRVHAFTYVGVKEFWKFQENLLDIPMLRQNQRTYHFYHEGMCEKIATTALLKHDIERLRPSVEGSCEVH